MRFASQAAPHTCAGVLPSPAAIRTTTSEAMTEAPAWSIIGAESGEPSGESAKPGHDASDGALSERGGVDMGLWFERGQSSLQPYMR